MLDVPHFVSSSFLSGIVNSVDAFNIKLKALTFKVLVPLMEILMQRQLHKLLFQWQLLELIRILASTAGAYFPPLTARSKPELSLRVLIFLPSTRAPSIILMYRYYY